MRSEKHCWSDRANTNVDDGQLVVTANTLAACQQACVDNANCTGIDFYSSNAAGQRCNMSGPWSGRRNAGTASNVVHYDLHRSCAGEY